MWKCLRLTLELSNKFIISDNLNKNVKSYTFVSLTNIYPSSDKSYDAFTTQVQIKYL